MFFLLHDLSYVMMYLDNSVDDDHVLFAGNILNTSQSATNNAD